ncbi:hypothetical protein [Sphingomonas asaccharolytica]|uniref:hypothetical protein n=1 Tax=Sphingomonas asaccharolytica TaxID=40681 RepID=UPI00082EC783|nr:hypothetical protein [Sphingomonas asaccharolytica]
MTDKIIDALVTGDRPLFNGGVLHSPGEATKLNLTALGVKSIDDPNMPGVDHFPTGGEAIVPIEVGAVAPHAPNPTAPQGIPPGTQQSGTGRLLAPAAEADSALSVEIEAEGSVDPSAKPKK